MWNGTPHSSIHCTILCDCTKLNYASDQNDDHQQPAFLIRSEVWMARKRETTQEPELEGRWNKIKKKTPCFSKEANRNYCSNCYQVLLLLMRMIVIINMIIARFLHTLSQLYFSFRLALNSSKAAYKIQLGNVHIKECLPSTTTTKMFKPNR